MDIGDLRNKPHLSASSVNAYLECGLNYMFGRIAHIEPEFIADNLVFGKAVHKALEIFHRQRMEGVKLSQEEFLNEFETWWNTYAADRPDIKYKEGNDFKTLLEQGKQLLTVYCEQVPEDKNRVIAVEEGFSFEIDGLSIPIIGYMDLVEEDENGNIVIVDFKTSAKSYNSKQIDENNQLTVYWGAAKKNGYADKEVMLRFDALIKTKEPKFEQYYTSRTEEDFQRLSTQIKTVWQGIQREVFVPNTNSWKCSCCEFKGACDRYLLMGS